MRSPHYIFIYYVIIWCIKQINIKFNLEEEEKALIKNRPLKDALLLRNLEEGKKKGSKNGSMKP
jgi:hypothetical protein